MMASPRRRVGPVVDRGTCGAHDGRRHTGRPSRWARGDVAPKVGRTDPARSLFSLMRKDAAMTAGGLRVPPMVRVSAVKLVGRAEPVGAGADLVLAIQAEPGISRAEYETVLFERSLYSGRLEQTRLAHAVLETALRRERARSADLAVDAAEVAAARLLSRRVAGLELALARAERGRGPSSLEAWWAAFCLAAGAIGDALANAALVVLGGVLLAFGMLAVMTVVLGFWV